MIIGVRELRNAKIQWPRFLALIDCGIEVDEVPAGLAGRFKQNFHVALAVKGARVADVAVVIDHRVNVSGLGPAHALQVELEGSTCRPSAHVERQCAWRDPMHRCSLACTHVHPEAM